MTGLGHDRYCDEVVAQTGLLGELVEGADLSVTVPTCPDWSLAQLLRHVGGNLRSVELAVRTGTPVLDPAELPEAAGPATDDSAKLTAWLTEGAAHFADTLRAAGPGAQARIWDVQAPTAFWARRAAHDLVIHRADAAGTVGADYSVAPELAADAIDEFLDLMRDLAASGMADLDRPGETLHLHATGTGPGVPAEWLIELGSDAFTWRHAHATATVAVRGPVADVLRVLYRRLPADDERVEVRGDAALLDRWLERVSLT